MRLYFSKIIFILILCVILVPGCSKKNQPPYVPYAPSGFSFGVAGNSYDFFTLAIDPDGDSVALRFKWQDGDTSDWSLWLETGEEITMSHSWAFPDSYYVKAQAKDKKDLFSEWSLPLFIKIVENLPPNTPSIPSGPSIGYVDSAYQFTSWAIDQDGDSIAIRFNWGDGDTTDWSNFVPSGMSVTIFHSWYTFGIYSVKAQTMDSRGLTSEWSLPHPVNIRTPSAYWLERSNQTSVLLNKIIFVFSISGYALKMT